MDSGWLVGTFAVAYLLGSIPFGLLLARIFLKQDIRSIGSGNIGATNVMRTGRKGLGIATLLLDAGKGAAAVWLAHSLYPDDAAAIAGLFAVLGHVFPIWLKYKGGKGVATALGVFFALNWMLGLSVCLIWLLVFAVSRYSSLSSILSMCYSPLAAYVTDDYLTSLLCLSLACVIIFSHRGNIERLLAGHESGFQRKAS